MPSNASAAQRTAVAIDSSCMLLRSASSLPSSAQQILEPMRILLPGSMPYSLGITQSASCFATCSRQHMTDNTAMSTTGF